MLTAAAPISTSPAHTFQKAEGRQKVVRIDRLAATAASGDLEGDASLILAPEPRGNGRSAAALYLPDGVDIAAEHQEIHGLQQRLHSNGLQLRLDSRRLAEAAVRLSEFAWSARRFEQLLRQPICHKGDAETTDSYLEQLITLARLLDQWGGQGSIDARRLGLEEVLDRLVVLSFWGGWIAAASSRRGAGAAEKASIIEELIQWIRANCHRSISLSELEQRSGYSQRSLRNAFQERFGCAPNEWIRRERMESARRRLLDAQPGETVSSIAEAHGYSHVSQFSRDFRGVFGLQPSQVMRRGRRPID